MMTFLALAAKMKWPVNSYEDKADAYLGKNSKGQMAVTKIVLHPVVTFSGEFTISGQDMKDMHDRSHRYCFVANSLADEVVFEVSLLLSCWLFFITAILDIYKLHTTSKLR